MDASHVSRALGLPPGTRIGRYTLVRRIATGGMAEVYLAQLRGAERFAKLVALKLILPQYASDPEFARMFLDEAKLASRLQHPHVTSVLDFGEFHGEHYITMEFVHGRHLLDLMRAHRGTPLPRDAAATIVSGVARALHHMHELRDHDGSPLGLVHRDVSPSNVLLSYEGAVKLTDFGIAKAVELTSATRTGAFKGKIGYASPEQCRGEPIDRRSDVFAAGILLYETTIGARAFSGPNEFAVLGKVARADYVPPQQIDADYPPALAELVARAMAVDPGERFATAAELAEAIDACAHDHAWRLSPARVIEAMATHFGEPPPLTTADERSIIAIEPTTVGAATVDLTRPRRLLPAVIGGATVAALVTAFALAQRDPGDASTAAVATPTVTDAPTQSTSSTVVAPAVVVAAPPDAPAGETTTAADVSTTGPNEAVPTGPSEAASTGVAEAHAPAPARTRAPRRRRPQPRRGSDDTPAVPVNLYPPGYQP